jgi:hypothetical protein
MFAATITALCEFQLTWLTALFYCLHCIVTLRPRSIDMRTNSQSFLGIIIEFIRALNEATELKCCKMAWMSRWEKAGLRTRQYISLAIVSQLRTKRQIQERWLREIQGQNKMYTHINLTHTTDYYYLTQINAHIRFRAKTAAIFRLFTL